MALTDKLTAIADAIRAKTGKTDGLTLEQMATEIEGIKTEGIVLADNERIYRVATATRVTYVPIITSSRSAVGELVETEE